MQLLIFRRTIAAAWLAALLVVLLATASLAGSTGPAGKPAIRVLGRLPTTQSTALDASQSGVWPVTCWRSSQGITGQIDHNLSGATISSCSPGTGAADYSLTCSVTLASVRGGNAAPQVAFLQPSGGQIVSGLMRASWVGRSSGPQLSYTLLMSSTLDPEWQLLQRGITVTDASVDTTQCGGGELCQLQLMATDGFNTGQAVSRPFIARNPLQVHGVTPRPGASDVDASDPMAATFSGRLLPSSVNNASFTLSGPGNQPVAGQATYLDDPREARFTPSEPLASEAVYTATLAPSIAAALGGTLGAPYTWSFTTAAITAPVRLSSWEPSPGSSDVPTNTYIAAFFDQGLDPASVGARALIITPTVGGSTSYDAARKAVLFHPAGLALTTTYTVSLGSGLRDLLGNAPEPADPTLFTTGGAASSGLRFTGDLSDQARDTDGDGYDDELDLDVGVEALAAGTYDLQGQLDVGGGHVLALDSGNTALPAGPSTVRLAVPGPQLSLLEASSPYTVTGLTLSGGGLNAAWPAMRVLAGYQAGQFTPALRLHTLPFVALQAGEHAAFDLAGFTQASGLVGPVSYSTQADTPATDCSVKVRDTGSVRVPAVDGWTWSCQATVQASAGGRQAEATLGIDVEPLEPNAPLPNLTVDLPLLKR